MNKQLPTTLAQAEAIWQACYVGDEWENYTTEQRLAAIRIRDGADDSCSWGVWNISDRD